MINVKIVYNSDYDSKLVNDLLKFLAEKEIKYEYHDMKYLKDRKKGFKIKNMFGARLDPFVGIYSDKSILKGFYTESSECLLNNIINYLNDFI